MEYRLARADDQIRQAWRKRFTPRLWTVDFARPMMAALTVPAVHTIRMDLNFLTKGDLAGLIWESEDRWSHPLLAYETDRDYRGVRLAFDWVAGTGVKALDEVHGATLTIEGRDADGEPIVWYVRLWNYVTSGTALNARVELDFDAMLSGYGMDGGLVWAGDIDRMFISVVPAAYDASADPLPATVSTYVELRNIEAHGYRSTIAVGDAFLPEHRLRICSGYDDNYHQAPERLVEQWQALGYRDLVNHYVGMSHYFALTHKAGGRFEVTEGLCSAATVWHRALLRAARAVGFEVILSLSFELFDAHAPEDWAQRNHAGARALTGWEPPSAILSPCHTGAMDWLCGIARTFADLAAEDNAMVRFQVGEPWWWVDADGAPCFYDAATVSAWTAEHGTPPPVMRDVVGERPTVERQYLDWLGARLAAATYAVRDAAQAAAPERFQSLLLFYAPQVLDDHKPDLKRANMPTGWQFPAFDILQLEDYDYVTAADELGQKRGRQEVTLSLGYPEDRQHYLAGFVMYASDADLYWRRIADAAERAMGSDVSEILLWAWPQVARDGFVWAGEVEGELEMDRFHDVRFPLQLGFDAAGGPEFSTQVAEMSSGYEQRNVQWDQARLSYDASVGVRSEQDLVTLLAFFRARRGQAFAFRFRDPLDWQSCPPDAAITPFDQLLGVGDGQRLHFPLVKRYGVDGLAETRRITRPVGDMVAVSVAGVEMIDGWTVGEAGILAFDVAPGVGQEVRAGFAFDVPMRFATDRLDISLSRWRGGELPAVPLVEVRE